ncbi:hypothetical protein [Hydrogenimonas thermophila]|uniref:Uncharacterized protein n=1 Tax=Hydrogenimonas thermophila TaxID=223786 RepID=A0A1I5NBQ6_9BACT|nr:hypothetical protein [Hydrogenimonas thermophila]WOE69177.1 hypothetical protein RZR91_08670 [Hydrogenimonas thermophila]WOE71687.1 hypothetical protein RZR97_08645 [Hydrogenimonas thermophila]SFP19278.1 hypothetical protein SAMN05216234_10965 [Hydrogenimonas thermophila]
MTVNSSGAMQQAQMRQMNGAGGAGNGGMKDIMQSLSQEERTQLREQMSSLSMEDRQKAMSQMKEVDKASMSEEDYFQSLLDILNPTKDDDSQVSASSFSIYA